MRIEKRPMKGKGGISALSACTSKGDNSPGNVHTRSKIQGNIVVLDHLPPKDLLIPGTSGASDLAGTWCIECPTN